MEQELIKYIGIYKFPIGEEPIILISNFKFKVEYLYQEEQNLMLNGSNADYRCKGYFRDLIVDNQKIIYDRFNELN